MPHPLLYVSSMLVLAIFSLAGRAADVSPPAIVAHRGLLQHAPENTLANFRACLELRLGFEFDVQKTRDGRLVCIHDDTLNRTTNGQGKVAEQTFDEIRRLDAGSWFDSKFAGEKVPTIEEVLRLLSEYRDRDVLVAVDLKAPEVEREVVRLAEEHKVLHRLLFIGSTISSPQVREQLHSASGKATTAVVANNPGEFRAALDAKDGQWVYFRFLPSKEQVDAVHAAGKKAFIAGATVSGNLPDAWQQAAAAGIDGILTDYPLELRKVLVRKR